MLFWLELCFGEAKPTKVSPPRGDGTVWKNFGLLFNAIDLEKYLGWRYVKLARYVKLSVYKHDRAQSGVATSRLVGVVLNVRFTTNRMCAKNNTHIYVA